MPSVPYYAGEEVGQHIDTKDGQGHYHLLETAAAPVQMSMSAPNKHVGKYRHDTSRIGRKSLKDVGGEKVEHWEGSEVNDVHAHIQKQH